MGESWSTMPEMAKQGHRYLGLTRVFAGRIWLKPLYGHRHRPPEQLSDLPKLHHHRWAGTQSRPPHYPRPRHPWGAVMGTTLTAAWSPASCCKRAFLIFWKPSAPHLGERKQQSSISKFLLRFIPESIIRTQTAVEKGRRQPWNPCRDKHTTFLLRQTAVFFASSFVLVKYRTTRWHLFL